MKISYCIGQNINDYGTQFYCEISPYIQPSGQRKRKAIFICPKCNNFFIALIDNVKSGKTKTCGCLQKETIQKIGRNNLENLVGQQFGKLTVLMRDKDNDSIGRPVWICRCECGSIVKVSSRHLLTYSTISCGCIRSKGEQKIKKCLENLNIKYLQEYTFEDCVNPTTNTKLRFDFYLPDYNCCIEYDGEQHFKENVFFRQNLIDTKYKDKIKNIYCINNNIKLIRIPY